MRDLDELFEALDRSAFRRRFCLRGREAACLQQKGLDTVLEHARDFIRERLAPARIVNDGRQTPRRNHPAFIAQHATATCCRGCLEKWHRIPKGRPLSDREVDYIVAAIRRWLMRQQSRSPAPGPKKSTDASEKSLVLAGRDPILSTRKVSCRP